MSDLKDLTRLRHMLDAARKATQFSYRRTRADLDIEEMFSLALIRLLEVIGEAAKGVSSDLRRRFPEVPWSQIAGTRDRLIHGYFDVDLDVIWAIVTDDLPTLIAELEKIISLINSR